jgi:ATP-dependent Clp protease ATP-binding subunit ClpA
VNEEIGRLQQFDQMVNRLSKYARNLNLAALKELTPPVYNREGVITDVKRILCRRNKANVLLTGAAGCGKTAIAEGLARDIAFTKAQWNSERAKAERAANRTMEADGTVEYIDPPKPMFADYIIYDLSMNSLVSGTKYRGEFEERLEDILAVCRKYPNIILFIDEIHQVTTLGCTEGSGGAGQILKPAMARGDIRIIGATTTEEAAFIHKDKALTRRFSEVSVPQLVGEIALTCTESILADYAKFHNVQCENISAQYLIDQVNYFLPNSVFPNNVIDVIDETLARAKFDGLPTVNTAHINATLSRMTGSIIL